MNRNPRLNNLGGHFILSIFIIKQFHFQKNMEPIKEKEGSLRKVLTR